MHKIPVVEEEFNKSFNEEELEILQSIPHEANKYVN